VVFLQFFNLKSVSSATKVVKVIKFVCVFTVSEVRTRNSTTQQASVFFKMADSDTKVDRSDPEIKCFLLTEICLMILPHKQNGLRND